MAYGYAHRFLDYSDTTYMPRAIIRFVYGLRTRRQTPVNLRQIEQYFHATSAEFTRKEVDKLVGKGLLVMLRTSTNRKRTGYVYEPTKNGDSYLHDYTYWDTPEGREIVAR